MAGPELPDDVGARGLAVRAEPVRHHSNDAVARILFQLMAKRMVEGRGVGEIEGHGREIAVQDVEGIGARISWANDTGAPARAACAYPSWLVDIPGTRPALPLAVCLV